MNISKFFIRSKGLIQRKPCPNVLKTQTRLCSSTNTPSDTGAESKPERNPTPIFFSSEVQKLLKQITGLNFDKIFRTKRDQKRLQAPSYQFMTSEELETAMQSAKQRAEESLQMPPVMLPRTPIDSELAKDPAMKGYLKSKHIFTDITYGVNNRERLIVVREPDGTLRKASWEERDRLNQIYFPVPGKNWRVPEMFQSGHLEDLLTQGNYEFVLDRACLQFEPDDPQYLAITHKVYEHVDDKRAFDTLRSTRHFGPLTFYLAWNRQIDNLLLECIQNGRIADAACAVRLLHILHPSVASAKAVLDEANPETFIKAYIESDSQKRGPLELSLQAFQEARSQRRQINQQLEEAHGQ